MIQKRDTTTLQNSSWGPSILARFYAGGGMGGGFGGGFGGGIGGPEGDPSTPIDSHLLSVGRLWDSLEIELERVERELPQATAQERYNTAFDRVSRRSAENIKVYIEEVYDDKPQWTNEWKVVETLPGVRELATKDGDRYTTLREFWDNSERSAALHGEKLSREWIAERQAQLAMQEAIVTGKATAFVTVLSHASKTGHILQVWNVQADGRVVANQYDVGQLVGRDFDPLETQQAMARLGEIYKDKAVATGSSYPGVLVKAPVDMHDVVAVAQQVVFRAAPSKDVVPLVREPHHIDNDREFLPHPMELSGDAKAVNERHERHDSSQHLTQKMRPVPTVVDAVSDTIGHVGRSVKTDVVATGAVLLDALRRMRERKAGQNKKLSLRDRLRFLLRRHGVVFERGKSPERKTNAKHKEGKRWDVGRVGEVKMLGSKRELKRRKHEARKETIVAVALLPVAGEFGLGFVVLARLAREKSSRRNRKKKILSAQRALEHKEGSARRIARLVRKESTHSTLRPKGRSMLRVGRSAELSRRHTERRFLLRAKARRLSLHFARDHEQVEGAQSNVSKQKKGEVARKRAEKLVRPVRGEKRRKKRKEVQKRTSVREHRRHALRTRETKTQYRTSKDRKEKRKINRAEKRRAGKKETVRMGKRERQVTKIPMVLARRQERSNPASGRIEVPGKKNVEQGWRKERKPARIWHFQFAWTLWMLLRAEHRVQHINYVHKSLDRKTSQERMYIGVAAEEGKSRKKLGEREEGEQHEESPWVLRSIIWYLAMIREQGMRNNQIKKRHRRNKRRSRMHMRRPPQALPTRGVIYASYS